jgi:hypothetical protein
MHPLQKCCVPYCDKSAVIEVGEALYCSGHALDRERAMSPALMQSLQKDRTILVSAKNDDKLQRWLASADTHL